FGEHKFLYLPDDEGQIYNINLKGTGQGTFTLKTQEIAGNQYGQSENFINLPVTTALKGTLDIGAANTTLALDSNGDGATDQIVAPTTIINLDQSQDFIAPTTTAVLVGAQGQPGYYRGDVKITFNAVDPIISGHENETSGVFTTEYSLDGGAWQIYDSSAPISVATGGSHTLSFYSIDTAGNTEVAQTLTFVIDQTSPVITINSPQSREYVRSEILPINVNIQDDDTGVATSTIQLDGKAVKNNDSIDLFFQSLGNHKVEVNAADFVGNTASAVVNFRVIATVDSAISDIERSYALGWITSKSIKNSLISKLKATLKLEKRIDEITIKISGKTKVVKRVERLEKKIDKALLMLLLTEARFYRYKFLNDQAYNILVEDINWLLSN
ncbi:MAG: hypothetical protein Q8N81_05080, partial [bacterium]|nr:hypothetical protein [bacterium]